MVQMLRNVAFSFVFLVLVGLLRAEEGQAEIEASVNDGLTFDF